MDRVMKPMAIALPRREIGPIGTTTRLALGSLMVGGGAVGGRVEVVHGMVHLGFEPLSVVVGVLVFPAAILGLQAIRSRRSPGRWQATGPAGTAINMLVFAAFVLTPLYVPALSFTLNAALIFYGASMLLAASRGYGGCEVLAISNWILRRDDQVGCFVLGPVDAAERRLRSAGPDA